MAMALYDNLLLHFLSFIYFHPLHLAYLLYFSPYILQLFSFLFPLVLTTSILMSALYLHLILEVETPTVCLLTQLSSLVVDLIGNVFEWEFETMCELYKDMGVDCEEGREDPLDIFVQGSQISDKREDPDEISSENSKMSEVLKLQDDVNLKGDNLAPQTPDRVCVQSQRKGNQLCSEIEEDQMQIFPKFPGKVKLLKCQSERRSSYNSENTSRRLHSSLSVRRTEQEGRALEALQSGGSMRKEKEWTRRLACKLYEERMAVGLCGEKMMVEKGEEMDLLRPKLSGLRTRGRIKIRKCVLEKKMTMKRMRKEKEMNQLVNCVAFGH